MVEVRIERSYHFNGYNFWIMDHRGDGTYIARPVELVFEKHADADGMIYERPTPTLEASGPFATELMRAMQTAIAQAAGEKLLDQESFKAIQKAMEDHITSLKRTIDVIVSMQRPSL